MGLLKLVLPFFAWHVSHVEGLQQVDVGKVAGHLRGKEFTTSDDNYVEESGSEWCTEKTVRELSSDGENEDADTVSLGELCYDVLDLPFSTDILNGTTSPIGVSRDFTSFRFNSQASAHAMLTASKRSKPLLWLHIHKAGGTLMCAMAVLAGERVVQPNDQNCNWLQHDGYQSSGQQVDRGITCAQRKEYFARGHYTWGSIERELWETDQCGDDFTYGTMLREPISLMTSMINFHPDIGKGFLTALSTQLSTSEPEVQSESQWPEWKMFDNFQVRLLASAFDVPAGQITSEHLNKAKEALATKFSIVTRLEDLPHSGASFISALAWSPDMLGHIGQPRNSSPHQLKFTADELDKLTALNKYDYALYRDTKLLRLPGMQQPAGAAGSSLAEVPLELEPGL